MKSIALMLGMASLFDGGTSVRLIDNAPKRSFGIGGSRGNRKSLQDHNVPPRSMTEKEKEHYAIHKNLSGLNS